MRVFETSVQELKNDVLVGWPPRHGKQSEDGHTGYSGEDPRTGGPMRCCIYKERAIISQRVKVAMGGTSPSPSMVEVLPIASTTVPGDGDRRGACLPGLYCHPLCPYLPQGRHHHREPPGSDRPQQVHLLRPMCHLRLPLWRDSKHHRPCERGCKGEAISMGEDKKASINPLSVSPAAPVCTSAPSARLWISPSLWT